MQISALMAISVLVPAACAAQEESSTLPPIDSRIESIITGGYWTARSQDGSLRVVVVREGHEELRYRAFVQWITTTNREVQVVATQDLGKLASKCFSLFSPVLSGSGPMNRIALRGLSRPMQSVSESITFDVGTPGRIKPLKNCSARPNDQL
jgi:hypothetical protein